MTTSGRKIPAEYDNPIDNVILDFVEVMNPFYKKLGFTPNILTTFSVIFSVLSIFFYVKRKYVLSSIFYLISYYFDCQDGNFARKYGMETAFGDLYDHLTDILSNVSIAYLLLTNKKISYNYKIAYVIIVSVLLVLALYHLSCTEIYMEKNTNYGKKQVLISLLKKYCKNETSLNYYKYFATGTYIMINAVIILLHSKVFTECAII